MKGMPPAKLGMKVAELKRLMAANGIENANQLANILGKNRSSVGRWLSGKTVITIDAAAHIKATLPKRK